MKNTLRKLLNYTKQALYIRKIDESDEFIVERSRSNIIRLTHSIEKGLCLRSPRPGFGYEKIKEIMTNTEAAVEIDKEFYGDISFLMAFDAISEYVDWNESIDNCSDRIKEIRAWLDKCKSLVPAHSIKYGGTIIPEEKEIDTESVINLFNNRHSARTFLDEELDDDLIKKAVSLANKCPSACNRQATRLYVVNHKDVQLLGNWLSGTGGFDREIKDFIIVCAKISAYMPQEYQQYEISTGIFVGYLTLALELFGIGCCVIQRDVINTSSWRDISDKLSIPFDEQVICILGCGKRDKAYPVPLSYRFDTDNVLTFINK